MMKQNLRLIFMTLLCAVFSTAWGETSTLTFTAKCGGSGTADDGASWNVYSDAEESSFDSDCGIHYGTNSKSVTYLQLSTSDISGTITQVVVNTRDARAIATVSVTVGGSAFTCSGSPTATNSSQDYTFTGSGSGEIVVKVDRGSSMTKAIYLKNIVVTYTTGTTPSGPEDPTVTFAYNPLKVLKGNTATNTFSPSDLNITSYSSDDESVATVSAEGVVTGVAVGVATITVSWGNSDKYNAGSAYYTVKVIEPTVYEKVTNDNQLVAGNEYILVTDNGFALSAQNDPDFRSSDNVTIDNNTVTVTNQVVTVLTLSGDEDNGWTFFATDNEKYLSYGEKKLYSSDDAETWTITSDFQIAHDSYAIKYNGSGARFACYSSNQSKAYLYVKSGSGIRPNVTIDKTQLVKSEENETATITIDPSALEVTYTTSNSSVAVVSADGVVTAIGGGSAFITATWAEQTINEKLYKAGSKTFNITIIELNPKNINSNYFVKVTSVDDLENGDAILIVHEGIAASVAMSTTQNNNNRGSVGVTISEEIIDTPSTSVQKIILTGATDAWYFYVGNGYLYAAGGSSDNHLKTEEDPDENAKATISISGGNATIQFQGSSTRNYIRYNVDSDIFSCYASGQEAVQIYKEIEKEEIEDVNITFQAAAAGYATLYYGDRNLNVPEGVKAYPFKIDSKGKGTKLSPYSVIPQGEGVLLELDDKSTLPVTKTFTVADAEDADSPVDENMLTGTDWEKTIVAVTNYKYYKLATNSNGQDVGFYYGAANGAAFKNGAHKAYLVVAPPSGGAVSSYVFEDNTNNIKSVNTTEKNDGQIYTISGVRINGNNLPAGIYIVNGKKMIVK